MHRARDVALVAAVQVLAVGLTAGWVLSGRSTAPDDGLQQIDVLMLDERVPGVDAVDGKPTMVVVTRAECPDADAARRLDDRYGLVVSTDRALAARLALPDAAERCSPGYVLLSGDGVVRYRTYDPGWPEHAQEQEILLEAVAEGHGG